MAAFKLVIITLASVWPGVPFEVPKDRVYSEPMRTYEECLYYKSMIRPGPHKIVRCLVDVAAVYPPTGLPHLRGDDYVGPLPLDRPSFNPELAARERGAAIPLPRLAPPQGPAPWPQDF